MIDEAIHIAKRSINRKHQTGCVIIDPKNDKILSNGWSHVGNWSYNGLYSVHAEIHALIRARHIDLDGCIAYVATIARKSGNVRCATPCLTCATALKSAGIDVVYFTINDSKLPMEMNIKEAIESTNLKIYKRRK